MRTLWSDVREAIFRSITKTDSGCWEWQELKYPSGYGRMMGTSSHRLSYQAFVGPIGLGQDIDHLCRNVTCCCPDHLEAVSRRENLRRGMGIARQKEKANQRRFCTKGHKLDEGNTYIRPSDGAKYVEFVVQTMTKLLAANIRTRETQISV